MKSNHRKKGNRMINLKFKTKGNANPNGKPRIFFACHPADFANSFDLICDAILKTHDCAIYYTEDMTDIEKAFRIFNWASHNVYYAGA